MLSCDSHCRVVFAYASTRLWPARWPWRAGLMAASLQRSHVHNPPGNTGDRARAGGAGV